MGLPTQLQTFLDYARAEAKRAGHVRTEPIHLAAALLRADPQGFGTLLEDRVKERLRAVLMDRRPGSGESGDAPETIDLLKRAGQAGDARSALYEGLQEVLRGLPSADDAKVAPRGSGAPAAGPDIVAAAGERQAGGHGKAPSEAEPARGFSVPDHLSRFAVPVDPDPGLYGRSETVERLMTLLGRREAATPCVLGPPGGGKTSLAALLAARIRDPTCAGPLAGLPVVRVRAEAVVAAQRSQTLKRIVGEMGGKALLFVDDLEVLAALGGQGADLGTLGVIRAMVGDPDARCVLTMAAPYFSKIEVHDGELAGKLVRVELPSLDEASLRRIASERAASLAAFHKVTIAPEAVEAATGPPEPGASRAHPGLLVERLDHACARAAMRTDRLVAAADLAPEKGRRAEIGRPTSDALAKQLRARIVGQDRAVELTASRLALTRTGLDLRPERPDGVFLFVGPTGVGKTALAFALAEAVFDDAEAVIRLDMSEYAHDWALSRLIGPQPGYVGYTEPAEWLTTRVRARPHALVLLDEIEKAHPAVWNAFLQVFDAGRLTDARGNAADFSKCIVVMTSNLGSRSFGSAPLGFASRPDQAEDAERRVLEAVKQEMAPELINRLDDIIVFRPLDPATIRRIAEREIARALARLSESGYELEAGPAAVDLIAARGYDPAYGARHLQRNIERMLLQPLVERGPGRWRASARGDAVAWEPSLRAGA